MHAPPGVPGGSTTASQGMEQASWGGVFRNWNFMLCNSSPFNRRPDTHTHTHTHTHTIPPTLTTTHHDGGLPSPLSYTLADDNPPLPSMPTQRLQQNLRERRQFQNDEWTNWEAVQLAGKLEAKQVIAKTIPPLITTTHHDGGLPSPLSYTLADDNPPLPFMPTQGLRQNLRERLQF